MAGKGSSLFSLPKLFIAIMIFAFTLWWMSPTQCPEVLSQPTMTISTTKEDDTVQTVDLNDFPEADSQAFLGAQFKVCKRPMIVTASNALYFPSLENLVGSLLNTQPASNRVKLTIIDLGMTNDQRDKAVKWCNAELINLNKENQKYLQDMDSQAWIPLGIDQIVSNKQDVCILYVDPRIEIHSSLLPIFQDMEKDGYWFAHTGKNMPKAWLGQNDPAVVPEVSTTTIGIAGNGAGFSSIITPWKSCITGGECAYDFLKADHKNLLNGLVHLQFQAAHKRDFQKDVTIHKEQKYSVTEEEDIAQDTVFYLHPATGVYSFSQYATGQCSRSVFTKPVLESGSQPSVQAATRPLTKGNYVVMAANQVVKYCFYIPVSALIWKERYGYDGIIMLIGDEHKWQTEPHLKIITKYLDIFGISYVYHINTTDTYSITLSQLARIFAAYLPELDITDDSFIITSDADLWPINRNLYKITEPNKEMLLLNSACCGGFNHGGKHYTMFPMGHIGMSKKTWKEVMNISEEKQKLPLVDMILKEGDEFFGREQLENVQHGGKGWYNDQIMISVKIGDWPGFPDKAQREVPGGLNRIDRAWWPGSFSQESVERARDAHLLHGLDNWNRVSQVLQYLIPADKFKLANEYAMEFIEAHPEPN